MTATLLHGDCLTRLRQRRDNYLATPTPRRFDVVLTDPPGAKGMAEWDGKRGGRDAWISWLSDRLSFALDCSNPGAALCCWAHPSTTGWTQRAIEDAGWIIFDRVVHLNAQGRAASNGRLAPGCEDWWIAHAPGAEPRPLNLDLEVVTETVRRRKARSVVLDDVAASLLDLAGGTRKSGSYSGRRSSDKHRNTYGKFRGTAEEKPIDGDVGGLSRFFPIVYAPKARFSERQLPDGTETKHPTAKSPTLIHWLLRLLNVRPDDLVADPFMGSGVVGEVAAAMGTDFWGCELEAEWYEEAQRRLAAYREAA